MTLKTDIESAVKEILRSAWAERDGQVVPDDTSLKLGNDAVKLDATVLYADMADSTKLVDTYKPAFAAEIYKTFLLSAARIIKAEGGEITAYDGDRVMAVYIGTSKNTSAVRTALKIKWAVNNIVQPALDAQYPRDNYKLRHVVGIDTSQLFVAKTGVRGANDLVWVGRAANHAAKLSALPDGYTTYISADIYNNIHETAKYSNGVDMWEAFYWTNLDGRISYRSTYQWTID